MSKSASAMSPGRKLGEIRALTGIRGIAALWVFFFHFRPYVIGAFPFLAPAAPLFNVGHLGVDLFFMLSGYIITRVHGPEFGGTVPGRLRASLKFLWLRIARIWPAMATMLIVWGFYNTALMWHKQDASIAAALDPMRLLRHLTMTQAWTVHADDWNPVDWAVSAEWFAYLVWICVIFVVFRLRRSFSDTGLKILSFLCLLPLIVVGFGLQDGTDLLWHDGTKVPGLALLRALCDFWAGALMAVATKASDSPREAHGFRKLIGLPTVLVLLVIAVIYLFAKFNPFWNPRYGTGWTVHGMNMLGSNESVAALIFVLMLIPALAHGNDLFTRALSSRLAVWFGRISYSFYLFHWLTLSLFLVFVQHFGWHESSLGYRFGIIMALAMSVTFGTLLWKYVEEFARGRLRKMVER